MRVDTVKLKIVVAMEGWEAEPGRCLEHDEGHARGDQEGPGEGEAIFGACPVSWIIIFCPQKNWSSVDYHHHYCILLSLPCADNDSARSNATSRKHWPIEEGSHLGEPIYQGHHELSGKNDENKSKPNSAFHLYYDRTLLLFSRPMRDKDTSALREMFQYSSSLWPSFKPNQI